MSVDVNPIKDQFARFLEANDWLAFKTMAEHYLTTAAKLKKRDIDAPVEVRYLKGNN